MILSVSRRTDIPNYYSEWFLDRLKEGYLYVRNPINIHQISKITLSPEVIDCIVFWTKIHSQCLQGCMNWSLTLIIFNLRLPVMAMT